MAPDWGEDFTAPADAEPLAYTDGEDEYGIYPPAEGSEPPRGWNPDE